MKPGKYSFAQLAQHLAGCRLVQVLRSPLIVADDFGSCRAWAEFDDGSRIELILAALDELIEFPARFDADTAHDAFEEVDGVLLSRFEVAGFVVAETTFSFGIILKDEPASVLCLDTMAGTRLDLHIYPLHRLLKDGGQAFFGSK